MAKEKTSYLELPQTLTMIKPITSFLDSCEEEQFTLLEELVVQQSYSHFKEGVDEVGKTIAASLQHTGMTLEVQEETKLGNHRIFRSPGCRDNRPSILLVGHMDTVFPLDSPFNWYREDGQKIYGPGVIDMKGGLVTAIFAIKALANMKLLDDIALTFICNSDEEIGSPTSKQLIRKEAEKSLMGLVFECGGLNHEIATGRKGKTGYSIDVKGQAGHAAFAGPQKASAIHEMAYKVIALEQLNDHSKKIVVNVGVIQGGIGPNTIADSAHAEIDTRFLELTDAESTETKISHIVANCTVPGTSAELYKTSGRLPMEQTTANRELYQVICQEAVFLDMPCKEELRSGVSDANTIAEAGIPVIDGMGPIGACDHSENEYMIKDSLPARTKLAALSIIKGWEHFR